MACVEEAFEELLGSGIRGFFEVSVRSFGRLLRDVKGCLMGLGF